MMLTNSSRTMYVVVVSWTITRMISLRAVQPSRPPNCLVKPDNFERKGIYDRQAVQYFWCVLETEGIYVLYPTAVGECFEIYATAVFSSYHTLRMLGYKLCFEVFSSPIVSFFYDDIPALPVHRGTPELSFSSRRGYFTD